jgi:secernin
VIFAKNSDRPIFDCQPLLFRPRQAWSQGSRVRAQYVELPQAEATYAHLGSSPYWCWGYEEGINEYGLAIGNEAIYTRVYRELVEAALQGSSPPPGLLGMDLIRLALERCPTAQGAVELMGQLVEQYGQFGSGNPRKSTIEGSYDNSFLIADPREAWVFETAGRLWAARRLEGGWASISNQPIIRTEWERGSEDLITLALAKGWWPEDDGGAFDFARAYIDEKTARQVSHLRKMRSQGLLAEQAGKITPRWMMRIARDHYEDTFLGGPAFDAADPDFLSLCMHVSPAGFTWGNTASSCVAVLPRTEAELPVFWWTPGPPCNGCYVPFFVQGSRLPEIVSRAGTYGKHHLPADSVEPDEFSPQSYWWLFRRLNDQVKGDPVRSVPGCYHAQHPIVRERFDALERAFEAEIPRVMKDAVAARQADPGKGSRILDEFSASCVRKVVAALEELTRETTAPGIEPAKTPYSRL